MWCLSGAVPVAFNSAENFPNLTNVIRRWMYQQKRTGGERIKDQQINFKNLFYSKKIGLLSTPRTSVCFIQSANCKIFKPLGIGGTADVRRRGEFSDEEASSVRAKKSEVYKTRRCSWPTHYFWFLIWQDYTGLYYSCTDYIICIPPFNKWPSNIQILE